jgi:pyridoxal phosphate enzyme (YggS family)
MVSRLEENIRSVRERISAAATRAGRHPSDVKLVAIGKTRPVESLEQVIHLGVNDIGENRVQELIAKQDIIGDRASWHFVGALQRNKVRQVVGRVVLIHSVDKYSLAAEIDDWAARSGVIQPVLIQVNVAGEPTKQGIEPKNVEKLVAETAKLSHINIEGLMTVAPLVAVAEDVRPVFERLRRIYDELASQWSFKWLSMGMTNDFEIAIEEGANLVRIGRAIFSTDI